MRDFTDKESGLILVLALLLFMLAGCATVPAGAPFDACEHDRMTCYT